ncbi:hypothetical protein OK074_2111 [Actinobacteria bacterium OK074]|nr:hypothetical protein OK074_2111 [Actinobacteria bacterium OK074]
MDHGIEEIVAQLPTAKRVTDVWAEMERRLADGDIAFVGDLGMAVAQRSGAGSARVWQYASVLDTAIRLLALGPNPHGVEQLLRLVDGEDRSARRRARYVASLIASAQDVQGLLPLFRGTGPGAGASDELRACTVHELLLRGFDLSDLPEVLAWASSPGMSQHPLAWLPLRCTEWENGAELPSYSVHGSTAPIPFGPVAKTVRLPLRSRAVGRFTAREVTENDRESVSAAVSNWAEESNGRVEARSFASEGPLEEPDVPAALLGLGLDCLAGYDRRSDFTVSRVDIGQAWWVLFAAASTGGAYNHGLYGAYGRLSAWRSLGGLAGVAEGAGAEELGARVATCSWYSFGASTPWYFQVAWDIGLAALDPDRTTLTVLAATDTD